MNEWKTWLGGICPVASNTKVRVKFRRDSFGHPEAVGIAGTLNWSHTARNDDIVAYCIVSDWVSPTPAPNKYQRTIKGITLDVYDVLQAWEVSNPAIQHAIKKLLQPGTRGHKSRQQDLQEALVSLRRAIELDGDANA